MGIAIIADDNKKELMIQLCIAYCGILSKHNLRATSDIGKYISDATGLEIDTLMSGLREGKQQIALCIAYDEVDLLLYFRDTDHTRETDDVEDNLLRMCDVHNVPVATNIATAEALICALARGDLDWREIVNPRSEYNVKRREKSEGAK